MKRGEEMTELYLITGFLGAGKTTFLKKLIKRMSGRKMRVLVNEFGREGVDGKLLAELGVLVNEINNGSIFCACRLDKFEAALLEALADPPELIIVEASGLSDPTNIRKILAQEEFYGIKFLGSICVVDALNLKKVFSTARVCKKQISVSDLLLINKADLADEAQLAETERLIHESCPNVATHRTSFGDFEPQWLEELNNSAAGGEEPRFQTKDLGLQKALVTLRGGMTEYELTQFLEMFLEDTYRVKGFVELAGAPFLVDCVGAMAAVKPYTGAVPENGRNRLVVLAGPAMPMQKSLEKAAEWYKSQIISVERGDGTE